MKLSALSIVKSVLLADNYELQEELGQGSYGSVYVGTDIRNNKQVAIKQLYFKKTHLSQEQLAEALNLRMIHNDHVVAFFDSFYDHLECSFNIVMERCHSSLRQLIKAKKVFTQQQFKTFLVQISSAFLQLQREKMMHLDLKPQNILVDKQGESYKICDFGCSQVSIEYLFSDYKNNVFGTMEYLAPEQYLDSNEMKVRSSADIWSLGIILYEMLFRHLPFSNPSSAPMNKQAIYKFYNSEQCKISFRHSDSAPVLIVELIRLMLRPKPIERITWKEVKDYLISKLGAEEHDFLNIRDGLICFKIVLDLHVSFALSLKSGIDSGQTKFWKINRIFLISFSQRFIEYALLTSQQFMKSQHYRLAKSPPEHLARCHQLIAMLKALKPPQSNENPEQQKDESLLKAMKQQLIPNLQKFKTKLAQCRYKTGKAKFLSTFSEELCAILKSQKSQFVGIYWFQRSFSYRKDES